VTGVEDKGSERMLRAVIQAAFTGGNSFASLAATFGR